MNPRPQASRASRIGLLACCLAACTARIEGQSSSSPSLGAGSSTPGAGPGSTVTLPTGVTELAKARVRRLTAAEIRNSTQDLFGYAPSTSFPTEAVAHELQNRFESLGVSVAVAEALQAGAEEVAAQAASRFSSLVDCSDTSTESACTEKWIREQGELVYRRALDSDDVAHLLEVYTEARALTDHSRALQTVAEAMLQSPHFLFRTELGDARDSGKSALRLTPDEHASALSFYLWAGPPDRALLSAARAGELNDPAARHEVIGRLTSDPRARRSLRSFFMDWFEARGVGGAGLSAETYPEFGDSLASSLLRGAEALVDDAAWQQSGGLRALLTPSMRFVDSASATVLGVSVPASDAVISVPATGDYAGLLTEPAFLATHSRPSSFSPVFLGHFVRSKLLCQTLPPPPNDVPALPEGMVGLSDRQRFAQHESDPACSGCHELMDPLGFAFERYDALGRAVEQDPSGASLTGAGRLMSSDVDGEFSGPRELAEKLIGSSQVRDCYLAHLMEYALGREVSDPSARLEIDEAALLAARDGLAAGDTGLVWAFGQIAASDALFLRDGSNVPAGGAP